MCKKSTIDRDTNSLSIIDCIDEITITLHDDAELGKGLTVPVNFQFVSLWLMNDSGKDVNADIKILFINPKGKTINEYPGSFTIDKKYKRFRSRMNLEQIFIKEKGRYFFEVQLRDNKSKKYMSQGSIPFDILVTGVDKK